MVNSVVLSGEERRLENDGGRDLHVLISAYACQPGQGSEAGVGWNWAVHLSRFCRVSVITRAVNRHAIDSWLSANSLSNVRFHYLDAPSRFRSWAWGKLYYARWQQQVLRQARTILVTDPFDLVHHLNVVSVNYPIFLQHLPVPLIYGPLGGGEVTPQAFRAGRGLKEVVYEALRDTRQKIVPWDPRIRSTMAKAARIFVANYETKMLIPPYYHTKTSIMPAVGIESALRHQPSRNKRVGCHIYTAGRLLHWKGFDLAIQAFARVAARYPDSTFTIIGDGPHRARLEYLAETEQVSDRVRITGWLPRSEVLRLADENDIFLFPSLRDSGGMVVLEAIVAGKPVICLDTGGPAVIVTPECGIKVPVTTPPRVVSDLTKVLDQLMSDAELRQRMEQAAMQHALDEFLWEKKAEKVFGMYKEVLAAGHQAGANTA